MRGWKASTRSLLYGGGPLYSTALESAAVGWWGGVHWRIPMPGWSLLRARARQQRASPPQHGCGRLCQLSKLPQPKGHSVTSLSLPLSSLSAQSCHIRPAAGRAALFVPCMLPLPAPCMRRHLLLAPLFPPTHASPVPACSASCSGGFNKSIWLRGSEMDMVPIPEDAEMTSAATSVKLPHERYHPSRHGRNILVAVDHGQDSQRAFTWALTNLVRMADTLHLVHVLPTNLHHGRSEESTAVLQATEVLFDKLQKEAYEIAMVKTERRIMEGEPGKVICHESARLEPAAVVMGCRGRGVVKSVLLGSVSEYCTRHCLCPVIIVPRKDDRVHELEAE